MEEATPLEARLLHSRGSTQDSTSHSSRRELLGGHPAQTEMGAGQGAQRIGSNPIQIWQVFLWDMHL